MGNIKKFETFNNRNGKDTHRVSDSQTRMWMSDENFWKLSIKNFGIILHSVYNPLGYWKKKPNGKFGVMNLPWEDRKWSILNKINTNYSALRIIINECNKILENSDKNIEPFKLGQKFGTSEWYEEYNRFINFLKRNNRNIFLKIDDDGGSSIINKVIDRITITSNKGDKAELITKKYLPILNPKVSNIKMPEGYGDTNDMLKGIDIYFDYNNREYTIQVKKVQKVINTDSEFITKGASVPKHYGTDYYSILDENWVYFFKNRNIKLRGGELIIPQSSFIKKFKYK